MPRVLKGISDVQNTIVFLMPEFPGHTHTWLWREICGLREFGLTVHLASTRPPKPEDKATHAFVTETEDKVFYSWPPKVSNVPAFAVWCLAHPRRSARCVSYARALSRDGGKSILHNLALALPAWRLARRCRSLGVRHIHVATPANSLIIAQIAGIIGDLTCDTTINARLEWWGGAMREKLGRCSVIFPVADWMRKQIATEYPEVLARTHVARHGVDTAAWEPAPDAAPRTGCLRVASVGRLHPAKGHDDLLRAVHILIHRGRNVMLRIAGGGTDRDRLYQMIQELDIAGHATLEGPLQESDVRALLDASDVFALASHAEALGVVFMEAMALGVPVIATRTQGAQEVVEDGATGLLVDIKSPDQIAQAIESLLVDTERRTSMAASGLQRVRDRFDSRVGARIVSDQIKSIISQNASRPNHSGRTAG